MAPLFGSARITESDLASSCAALLVHEGAQTWEHAKSLLATFSEAGPYLDLPFQPAANFALAIATASFCNARCTAPLFDGMRDVAERVEYWTVLALFDRHADAFSEEKKKARGRYSHYQDIAWAAPQAEAMCERLAVAVLTDTLGPGVKHLKGALPSGQEFFNPIVSTTVGDLLFIEVTTFSMVLAKAIREHRPQATKIPLR